MAIAFRDSKLNAGYGSSANVTKPTGTAQNDILIVILALGYAAEGGVSVTPPAGWSNLGINYRNSGSPFYSAGQLGFFSKIAGASEPSSYTFTWSGNKNYVIAANAFSGGSIYYPIVGGVLLTNTGSDASLESPTLSSNGEMNTLELWGWSIIDSEAILTLPVGLVPEDETISVDPYTIRLLTSWGNVTEVFSGDVRTVSSNRANVWVSAAVVLRSKTSPAVPTGLIRTGTNDDVTPSFSASISDPDLGQQVKARFELYQNDGVTLIGSVDSAYVVTAGTATAEYATGLALGNYKVRARSIDSDGMTSAWTSLVSFSVKAIVTKDSNQLWDVYSYVTDNLILAWDLDAGNVKDLRLQWDVYEALYANLILLWNQQTPWTKVPETPETIWTKVGEL